MSLKYRCTYCKTELHKDKIFYTLEAGYKHFKKEKHEWGGLEHIDYNKRTAKQNRI